ncbi:hypothetical protein [Nostoc sp.]|uniref:hypothetical protein n=1 Tax=Nostoc sp. TaxID=1180 RepID=UPI002FFB9711
MELPKYSPLANIGSILVLVKDTRHQRIYHFYIKVEHLHKFQSAIQRIYHFIKSDLFVMAEPTFVQVFGAGATRLASGATTPSAGLFIADSALTGAGLATPSTATAEGHLVAIVVNAKSSLIQTSFEANIDQSLIVADGFSSFTTRGADNTAYRQDQLTLSLAKIDTSSTIDPNNY